MLNHQGSPTMYQDGNEANAIVHICLSWLYVTSSQCHLSIPGISERKSLIYLMRDFNATSVLLQDLQGPKNSN